ncbi:alkaline phosphatase family protein [Lachnospiraceae bacterium AM48-27BH]|nr:alkaline phosphatase family protein [Lachnospiraceae bacterium AM48-27BH]
MKALKREAYWLGRSVMMSLLVNLFIESASRKSIFAAVGYLVLHPVIFLLNGLIVLLPYMLVFLTRRRYFIMVAVSAAWCCAGVVNGFLLTFRTTPFTAADLRLIKYALNMLTMYMTWWQIILAAAGIIGAVLACVWCYRKAPVIEEGLNLPVKVAVAAASLVVVIGTVSLAMGTGVLAIHFGNIGQAFRSYGFPYCFSVSLFHTGISKPKTYDVETMTQIEKELSGEQAYTSIQGQKPNVIMLQLESFFDPLQYRNYEFQNDPVPFFRYLKDKYPSGYLSVPSVGAGTANTEFECITAMNLDFFGPGEYPYKTVLQKTSCESVAFDLKELGYGAHAIHNNEGTFYDRHKVFSQLGFDTFTPIEYMYNVERNPTGWCKDKILIGEIEKNLNSTDGPDFIYTISVQGHGAYPDFEYYCSQVSEMDQFIQNLVFALNRRKEPTVLIMYGDHLPGFSWEAADMKNNSLFQTQYVVWNNLGLPIVHRTVEAYQLASYVLEMLDIHEGTMVRYHQGYLTGQIGDKQQYLDDMKLLEYDILYGKHDIYEGNSPFQATNLHMGIDPIEVTKVVYEEPDLLIFGENFNEYSKVFLGDKQLETTYVWPELILVRDVARDTYRKEKDTLSVKQVGKDKVPLGEAQIRLP